MAIVVDTTRIATVRKEAVTAAEVVVVVVVVDRDSMIRTVTTSNRE